MPKTKIPKKIAGYRVPKAVRKNSILKMLLASERGREILAKALVAAAGAAAAVLVEEKEDISEATQSGKRKGRKALDRVGKAFHHGSEAALDVVRDAVGATLPKKYRKDKSENPQEGVVVH